MIKPARKKNLALIVIVLAQFLCTSLWFAGNAVMPALLKIRTPQYSNEAHIIAAVQFGFIFGTLCFAAFRIADKYPPVRIFFLCAMAAALCNMGMLIDVEGMESILAFRFLTGFFLAGIYPVGMKIAVDIFENDLGKALGYLVAALVLGTALPHLLNYFMIAFPWKLVLLLTSSFSFIGGFLMVGLVTTNHGAHSRETLDFKSFLKTFRNSSFRTAALGYFGHMWELYAFWTFVPLMITQYLMVHPAIALNSSLISFTVIGGGSIACIAGGYLSKKYGHSNIAFGSLFLSGCFCLLSPLCFYLPPLLFTGYLLCWGLVVIADSPMFSTLIAKNAPLNLKGTAITFVTCIGFAITILSIELLHLLQEYVDGKYLYLVLALGPLSGLLARYNYQGNAKRL